MTERALLSIAQAQEQLGGISRTTVYELIKSGDLRRVKIGARALITSESLAAYLVRQRHGTDQPYDVPMLEAGGPGVHDCRFVRTPVMLCPDCGSWKR